jgi:hypothetical protein
VNAAVNGDECELARPHHGLLITLPSFCGLQLIGERACIVNFAQRFGDGGGIDGYGTGLFVGENAVEDERLDIAVENDANEFVVLVHDRAAAVASDDVCVGNEIEMR